MPPNLIPFEKVAAKVEALSLGNHDAFVPVDDIEFDSLDTIRIAGSQTHQLKPIAQQLICNRLGVPAQYMRKCPEPLQAENLNHWIRRERNPELFFRFDGQDQVRAIFTDRYKVVDNGDVIDRISSLGYKPYTLTQCLLDGEFMSLSIPDGNKAFSINGDKISPGISVSNSEVGLSSLHISSFFLRLVCTNGLVAKTEFSVGYRHVSTKILDQFPEKLDQASRELLAQADQFRYSVNSRVEFPENTIQSFNRQFGVNEKEQEAVNWGFQAEPGNTMYHVVNAYTKGSQYPALSSAESRHKLQKTAGNILSMVKSD